ncbi:hypothetical protein OSB04_029034 [Centaurea solstitialis]|uniref:Uncharacterized protein n=1 Tax=Centaurea solstitialis TaxID=347529 RepID=A0AA38T1P1_9ASTR|nr:hypothetical protein OSB04_029034 [Centaurea solstitialis]
MQLQVGERYESPKQLKECITCYALANGFSIWYERSSSTSLIARCGSRPPRISDLTKGKQRKAKRYPSVEKGGGNKSVNGGVMLVKDEHTCSRNFKYGSLINYKWIGSKFGHRIRCNPEIKLVEIAELVLKKYKCQVTPSICSRARSWALNEYQKSLEEHYGLLRSYGDELLRSNPGSTVKLDVTVNPVEKTYFDRFYEGWKIGCRRIIALDGCFLKGVCGGELLTAIGRDGNNHIFPGLVQVVKDVMPNAEHRQCARHIYENFRKVFSGVEFRNLFWRASKASYPQLFESVMNEIRGCDSVENGFSECFNFVLLKVRHKPIITMLEAIRTILMERMNTMRRTSDTWAEDICPSIKKKLDMAKDQQRFWRVIPKRMPRRPKKQRKKVMHEPSPHHGKVSRQGSVMTCQRCFQVGHNKRGCKQNATHGPPKSTKPPGRPRKTKEGSVDKRKEKMVDKGSAKKDSSETPNAGGFMRDARKTYQQPHNHEGKGKTKKAPLPPRRRHSERIAKMPKPPIKGPRESNKRRKRDSESLEKLEAIKVRLREARVRLMFDGPECQQLSQSSG